MPPNVWAAFVLAAPFRIAAHRNLRRFHQQKAKQRVARPLPLKLRPTGRGLSRSGKTVRTGRAASAGRERGKLSLNLFRVTVRTLQIVVGVLYAAQHLERLAATAALVFIQRHHLLLVS